MSRLKSFNSQFPGVVDNLQALGFHARVDTEDGRNPAPCVRTADGAVRLAGTRNPTREAELDFVRCGIGSGDVICLGFGAGHPLKVLLESAACRSIVAVPLDLGVLLWTMENCPFWDELVGNPKIFFAPLDFDLLGGFPNHAVYVHAKSASCVPDERLREKLMAIRLSSEAFAEAPTAMEENIRENLAASGKHLDAAELFNRFPTSTCIVAGGGPSLERYAPILSRRRPGVILIACSTVARKLNKAGVLPDFHVFLEPGEAPMRHFDGIWDCGAPLVAYTHSQWRALERYQSPVYLARNEVDPGPGAFGQLWSRGNVSQMAASLAVRLGATEIVFAGVDLAFPSGAFYCSDVPIPKTLGAKSAEVEVESVDGGKVRTSMVFHLARRHLEDFIGSCPPEISFVNIGQSGAAISGVKGMDAAEAERRYFQPTAAD